MTGKSPALTPVSLVTQLSLFLSSTGRALPHSLLELEVLPVCAAECLKIPSHVMPRPVLYQHLLRAPGSETMLLHLRAGLPGTPLSSPVGGDSGSMQPSPLLDIPNLRGKSVLTRTPAQLQYQTGNLALHIQ